MKILSYSLFEIQCCLLIKFLNIVVKNSLAFHNHIIIKTNAKNNDQAQILLNYKPGLVMHVLRYVKLSKLRSEHCIIFKIKTLNEKSKCSQTRLLIQLLWIYIGWWRLQFVLMHNRVGWIKTVKNNRGLNVFWFFI